MAVTRWCHIPKVEIAAVCDVSKEMAEEVARQVEQLGKPRPKVYWGETVYLDLCRQEAVNLVYVCTDWMSHVPIAIHAMEQGRSVAVEVPAALTLKDIWKLIDTAERTRQHCMMLENAVYDRFEMAVYQMVHEGLLGELVHVEGGYAHPIGDRWTAWRMEYSRLNAGDVYPTHSIGAGYAAKYPVPEVQLSPEMASKVGIEMEDNKLPLNASQIETLLNYYAPSFPSETIALAKELDARGGMSYFMDLRLAQCLQQGLPLDMDVYDLAEWCCIAELSKRSIEQGSMPVMIPDFVNRRSSVDTESI